jgi:hypothetical protein
LIRVSVQGLGEDAVALLPVAEVNELSG